MATYNFYVVFTGREPGIYTSLETAQRQVQGFSSAYFRGYTSLQEAICAYTSHAEGRPLEFVRSGVVGLSDLQREARETNFEPQSTAEMEEAMVLQQAMAAGAVAAYIAHNNINLTHNMVITVVPLDDGTSGDSPAEHSSARADVPNPAGVPEASGNKLDNVKSREG
ncbi:Ribonuclease H1, N-terminal [Trema orientale]|uniref:Ribonuclease H1, N-terminal n=1 Tax=Trema orientale TaxID=63057 RepID=A0A2P5F7R9_TREOI|nr:Ribonuclease H1, N-terminal [Trema orientale]